MKSLFLSTIFLSSLLYSMDDWQYQQEIDSLKEQNVKLKSQLEHCSLEINEDVQEASPITTKKFISASTTEFSITRMESPAVYNISIKNAQYIDLYKTKSNACSLTLTTKDNIIIKELLDKDSTSTFRIASGEYILKFISKGGICNFKVIN